MKSKRQKLNWRNGRWSKGASDGGCKLNIEGFKNYKEGGLVTVREIGKK